MILDKLAESTRRRVAAAQERIPLQEIRKKAEAMAEANRDFPFEKALRKEDIQFICEIKKASPSKGILVEDFPYLDIAKEYEDAGAACISVLTEPEYFLGRDAYLEEIQRTVSVPILRKDFTLSEYQIYEAKALGAGAVLLIAALLEETQLKDFIKLARCLGLSALVEVHDGQETAGAIKAGAGIIGVNNRNLKDFTVDINNSIRLRSQVPEEIIFLAESGIKTPEDIQVLRENRIDGVLIGETLMKSRNKRECLEKLRGNCIG